MAGAFAIEVETPIQDDVRAMVAELNAYLRPLTPPQFQFQMTVEQMADVATTLFVVRDAAGNAVGMGALKREDATTAEVKRMFTRPACRNQGVGSAVLSRIQELARREGVDRLVLETGNAPGFEPAHKLYESNGFRRCGAVLGYPDSGYSAFFEKRLGDS